MTTALNERTVTPTLTCPTCHSTKLVKNGKVWRTKDGQRMRVQNYMCNNCGHPTSKPLVGPPRDEQGRFAKVN